MINTQCVRSSIASRFIIEQFRFHFDFPRSAASQFIVFNCYHLILHSRRYCLEFESIAVPSIFLRSVCLFNIRDFIYLFLSSLPFAAVASSPLRAGLFSPSLHQPHAQAVSAVAASAFCPSASSRRRRAERVFSAHLFLFECFGTFQYFY